jgi:beta-phosphoglucomutase-like phosphatase (HAD superfamily)
MEGLAAVIFDFDGVILDSETAEFESHRLTFERYGAMLTPEEWCDQIGIWTEGYGVAVVEAAASAVGSRARCGRVRG